MKTNKDIEFIKDFCTGGSTSASTSSHNKDMHTNDIISVTRDTKHHLRCDLLDAILGGSVKSTRSNRSVKPRRSNNNKPIRLKESDHVYTLYHKNTQRPLIMRKVCTPDISELELERSDISKLGMRYKASPASVSSDIIEQVPMIKIYMIVCSIYNTIKFKPVTDAETVEFEFYFFNKNTDSYDTPVFVSVDRSVLVGIDDKPIIVEVEDRHRPDLLFNLLIKTIVFLINKFGIDIEHANINSFIAAARGGRIYTIKLNIHNIESNSQIHTMLINLLEAGMLDGIMAGNTFLYSVRSIVTHQNRIVLEFINPLRNSTIEIDLLDLLNAEYNYNRIQRISVCLSRSVLSEVFE